MAKSNAKKKKTMKTPRTISMKAAVAFFCLSLVINSLGNVLTLVTSMKVEPAKLGLPKWLQLGSAYWTAAETELGTAFGWNLFWAFLLLGVAITLLNAVLLGKWEWGRSIGNIIFMVPFSFLIQFFQNLFVGGDLFGWHMHPVVNIPVANNSWLYFGYILLNFLGVALIATAISIYQRVNLVLHPADDLFQILRFKYFNGKASAAMWASYIPPTIMGIIAFVMLGIPGLSLYGIGTIFAFLFQGGITGLADKYVFPHLKHQAVEVDVPDQEGSIVADDIEADIDKHEEDKDD